MKSWADAQKKMWDGFFESMPGPEKAPTAQAWEQMASMGEQTYKKSLQAQTDWIQSWISSISSAQGTPPQVLESAKQFQQMYEHWCDTQDRVWTNWFNMLKSFDPTRGTTAWTSMPSNPYQNWQENARKMIDTQFEWMQSWMGPARK